jgi:hypothetical protein
VTKQITVYGEYFVVIHQLCWELSTFPTFPLERVAAQVGIELLTFSRAALTNSTFQIDWVDVVRPSTTLSKPFLACVRGKLMLSKNYVVI